MRCVAVYSLAILAAVLAGFGMSGACAETEADDDAPLGDAAPTTSQEDTPRPGETSNDAATIAHLLFFSGADVWRNGAFMHGGFLYAHRGLNQDGPVFKLLLNGGLYRFHSGATDIMGRQLMATALPGWRWNRRAWK